MRFLANVMMVGIVGVVATGWCARADETDIPLDQLPKAVMDAAKAKFPGAQMRGAARETEDGKTFYEVSLTHKTQKVDASFQADGTLVLAEAEIPRADVPKSVAQAVNAKYPGAKITLVESVKKGPELKPEADYYEFHLETADKKSVEVEVDSQGKILKAESDGGEEEKN